MTAQNIGKNQRIIRIILGIIFIILGWAILKNNWLGVILNIIASYLLLTALKGKCWILPLVKRRRRDIMPNQTMTPPSSPQNSSQ